MIDHKAKMNVLDAVWYFHSVSDADVVILVLAMN